MTEKVRTPVRLSQATGTRRGPQHVPQGLKDPNYGYRWVNDIGYKLDEKREEGYEFVPKSELSKLTDAIGDRSLRDGSASEGSRIAKVGGTLPDGSSYKQYLMRIPKAVLEQRTKEHDRIVDEIDERLGKTTGAQGDGTFTETNFN